MQPKPKKSRQFYRTLAEGLTAVADPVRLRILGMLLAVDELCVSDVSKCLHMSMPAVSHHLRILREAGIVVCERRGQLQCYRFADSESADQIRTVMHIYHAI